MLVLTRKLSERITVGRDVVITIVRIDATKVRIGIDAPDDVAIERDENLPPQQLATIQTAARQSKRVSNG